MCGRGRGGGVIWTIGIWFCIHVTISLSRPIVPVLEASMGYRQTTQLTGRAGRLTWLLRPVAAMLDYIVALRGGEQPNL